jgi:hypothetical protein
VIIYDVVCITKSDVRLDSLKESQTHTDTSLDTLITAQIQLTHRFDRMTKQVDRITETSSISPETKAKWAKRREERGMRAYGVLIGANQGEALLDEISNEVFCLDDLRGDLPALEGIFSVV